ncbi:MAG: uncharacterized protein QG670_2772, partial [Thermoproteota archaeon]|nr:uncharacterized protein [Thermoproteota archaeon]
VTQPVSISIEKKKVLVVDDVSDTGKTLRLVCEEMKKEAVEVKVVTLYCKPWSEYKPDFCIKTTNAWIIFPWERCEMIKALERKMAIEGKTKKDVEEALRQMGLKSSIVKLFVKDIFGKRKYDEDKRIQ